MPLKTLPRIFFFILKHDDVKFRNFDKKEGNLRLYPFSLLVIGGVTVTNQKHVASPQFLSVFS